MMAGDWTPFETATLRKPEVLTIASKTSRSRHEVCGLLMEFWCWAGEQTVDGHVDAPVDGLPSAVGADVDFWQAVIDVGWLERNGPALFIPNAENWITVGAKARLDKTKRQQKWRRGAKDVDAPVDSDAPTEPSTTEQKRREQKREEEEAPVPAAQKRVPPPPKRKKTRKRKTPAPFRQFTDEFCQQWSAAYSGDKYPWQKVKDGTAAAAVWKAVGENAEKARAVFRRYFACEKPFFQGHTMAKLGSALAEFVAEHTRQKGIEGEDGEPRPHGGGLSSGDTEGPASATGTKRPDEIYDAF